MSWDVANYIVKKIQTSVATKVNETNVSPVQTTLTATKSYAVNDPFIYNGQLYKADSAISSGGTIVISGTGQNASPTTIEALINLHSGGGSGGHTILNSDGSAMNQRSKLQFDGLNVTDDSGNDKTVVKSPIFNGTTAQWEALSSAEKAKYTVVNLTDDYDKDWTLIHQDYTPGTEYSFNVNTTSYKELCVCICYTDITNASQYKGNTVDVFNIPIDVVKKHLETNTVFTLVKPNYFSSSQILQTEVVLISTTNKLKWNIYNRATSQYVTTGFARIFAR